MNKIFCSPVAVTSAVASSALGMDLDAAQKNMRANFSALKPLRAMPHYAGKFPELAAGWIPERHILKGRRYGAATNAAVHATKQLLKERRWTNEQTREAWLFAASSRGNISEIVGDNTARRPAAIYSASNTIHSEIAAAVSIECGIAAPWQMLSNGCSSGLDAIAWACHAVSTDLAPRAIVIAVDLPLNDNTLTAFSQSGLLASRPQLDPYASQSDGFSPAEAVVALAIEKCDSDMQVLGAWMAADAYDPIGLPIPEKSSLLGLLSKSIEHIRATKPHARFALCPHASGTAAHAVVECGVLSQAAKNHLLEHAPVLLTKPWTGHSLGASGALDVALLWKFMSEGKLPPNKFPCAHRDPHLHFPTTEPDSAGRVVLKISSAMGGLNTVLALEHAK